jgi:hypothetical protein
VSKRGVKTLISRCSSLSPWESEVVRERFIELLRNKAGGRRQKAEGKRI